MKRFFHRLFLLVLFALTLISAKAQTENPNQSLTLIYPDETDERVAEITFKVPKTSSVNKIIIILPNEGMEKVIIPAAKVKAVKVKLQKGINNINLQTFSGDQFVGNQLVPIVYTPDASGTEKPAVIGSDVIGGKTEEKKDGKNISSSADTGDGAATEKKQRIRLTPSDDITRQKNYTFEITPENLPPDANQIQLFRYGRNGKRETDPIKIFQKGDPKENKYKFDAPILYTVELEEGENKFEVQVYEPKPSSASSADASNVSIIKDLKDLATIECKSCSTNNNSLNTRAIIGIEQAGASSADNESRPFLNLFVNFPISFKSKDKREEDDDPPFSVWTDFRFTSTTVQSFARLANVSNTLINPLFGGGSNDNKINNVVQSFQLNAGIDYRILPEGALQGFFIPGKHSVSFIAGGGVTNPLKSDQTAQIFKIPTVPAVPGGTTTIPDPKFTALFSGVDFANKLNIAFVSPERDRFFRRWFTGIRLKTRFFENKKSSSLINQSPAMLDITIGQDEAITRKLTGKILTLEGFTPFPIRRLDYIYLFGGASTLLTRKVNETVPPFFFEPPVTNGSLTNNNTVIVPIDSSVFTRSNRDTFRFGIGIDLIRLLLRTDASPNK